MHKFNDHSYKNLFSEPKMVRDLLTGFIHEEWVGDIDLNTLEKVSGSYISDDLRSRESDVIWRVAFRGDRWLYLYLLMEFQSTVDKFMALRIMTYVGLLYQDLLKQGLLSEAEKLPPVLPIVLYNGERRWNAATDVASLIEPVPGKLDAYQPALQYLLLDEGRIVAEQGLGLQTDNAAEALFRFEFADDAATMLKIVTLLAEYLKSPEQASLRRAFLVHIKWVLNKAQWTDNDTRDILEQTGELEEVKYMLAERINRWPDKWLQEGREQGREKGRLEGIMATAEKMVQHTDLSDGQIAEITGLALDKIRQMRGD